MSSVNAAEAAARVGQRPAGRGAGPQPLLRVRRDGQRAAGEILHPVPLTSGNGGGGGGYQPARLVAGGGAELGRALQRQRRRGRAAPSPRVGRGGLEQRRHLLVRVQGGGGQMPRLPVGLLAERLRELAMGRGALGKRRAVVDRRADQRVRETQPGPVDRDQAQLLGGRQRLRFQTGNAAGHRQVGAVGHRRQQQRGLRPLGQRADPGGDDGRQPVTERQRLLRPAAAGRGVGRYHRGQLDQRHRVAGRLGQHLRPGPPARRPGLRVEQPARVRSRQRFKPQLRETPVKAAGGTCPRAPSSSET